MYTVHINTYFEYILTYFQTQTILIANIKARNNLFREKNCNYCIKFINFERDFVANVTIYALVARSRKHKNDSIT